MPNIASINIITLKKIANVILVITVFLVILLIFKALEMHSKLSSIKTISLASIVASLPRPPIAIPTSASLITGTSLIPSPTKATLLFFLYSSSIFTLSSGSKFPKLLSILSFLDISLTTLASSPDNMIIFFIPFFFNSCSDFFALSLILSLITI